MKLYENKKEITLKEALVVLFTNNVPNSDYEYMISFDYVSRLVAFGKAWTKKDPANWGKNVCKYYIHEEYGPVISYDDADLFLMDLMSVPGIKKHLNEKEFHIWKDELC